MHGANWPARSGGDEENHRSSPDVQPGQTWPRAATLSLMNVSLTEELRKFVDDKVASGLYHSASEVIREGLRLLAEQEAIRAKRVAELRRKTKDGLDQRSEERR